MPLLTKMVPHFVPMLRKVRVRVRVRIRARVRVRVKVRVRVRVRVRVTHQTHTPERLVRRSFRNALKQKGPVKKESRRRQD